MAFQAVKQNEERVKSVGIETFKVKLLVFVVLPITTKSRSHFSNILVCFKILPCFEKIWQK